MTGIRQSMVFSLEDEYGQGKGASYGWIAPPPGTYFTSQHNRNVQRIQSTGTKFWDAQAYGSLSGSWSWSFTFDYNYLEPFYLAFEHVTQSSVTLDDEETPLVNEATSVMNRPLTNDQGSLFTFEKVNNDRIPSFTVRRKILNKMVGGSKNETTELTGCIVKSIQFQRSAGTSKIDVVMSGFYSNEVLVTNETSDWSTDYEDYEREAGLVEYSCLYAGDLGDNGLYMANTESIGISMDNSAAAVYSVCSPFASNYYEGLTQIGFSTTCYSTDPLQYKTRLYSGGFTNQPPSGTAPSDNKYRPMSKGMRPADQFSIACYSDQITRDDPQYNTTDTLPSPNPKEAFASSKNFVGFQLDKVVIKSMPWQKGDGGKLQDSISGSEARKLTMYVKSLGPYYVDTEDGNTSIDITGDNNDAWFKYSNDPSANNNTHIAARDPGGKLF